jgi:hypothetical protein
MPIVRRFYSGSSLLGLLLLGCNANEVLEPTIDAASAAAPVSKMNAPSNTKAVAVSHSRIDVSWQDNSNETGFEVYEGAGGSFAVLAYVAAGTTDYSHAGLRGGTEHCYKLRAFRTAGSKTTYSAFSNTACAATVSAPVPAAPSAAVANPVNSRSVSVSWTDNAADEDGFRVERSTDLGSTWTLAHQFDIPNVTSAINLASITEQEVCHRVIAFNGFGDSPASNIDCTTPPAGVTGLTASAVDQQTIQVAWIDNSAVEDGYEVMRTTGGPWTVVVDLPANSTNYRDAGLSSNATYSYEVRAKKDAGYSDFSDPVSVVLANEPPAAPSGTNASPITSTEVVVNWIDNSSNEDGFRIERSIEGSWVAVGTVDPWTGSFVDVGVPTEQQLCYRVVAFNGSGDSAPSNIGCTIPNDGPTNLTATEVDQTTFDLTWSDNSRVEDGYEVHRVFPLGNGETAVVADLPANSTAYRVTEQCSVTYMVRAKKDGGFSAFSNSISVGNGSGCW